MTEIFLREISRTDMPAINQWRANQEILGQLVAPFRFVGHETDEKWFDSYLASRSTNVRLAICLKQAGHNDGIMIGVVYLLNIDWLNRSAEFGIWIGSNEQQGKRIGETATRLALLHGFNDLNLERIHLSVLAENERAIRLYNKMGFVQEGLLQRAVFKQGRYKNLIVMAIFRDTFTG